MNLNYNFLYFSKPKQTQKRIIHIPHILFIIFIEVCQINFNQTSGSAIIDSLFLISLLIILQVFPFYPLLAFMIFAYEIIETYSWIYTGKGISFQTLAALDFTYCLKTMPEIAMKCFLATVLIFGFSSSQFIVLRLNNRTSLILLMSGVVSAAFLSFVSEKYDFLFPFRIKGLFSATNAGKILASFNTKYTATLEANKKKNLIMLEIESFETKLLGRFNPNYKDSMPFLSNLTKYVLHYPYIKSQPYTTWSAAGMFAVHCGFPLIVNDVDWGVRGSENFESWTKLPCISDYLHILGYKQKAFCSGSCDIMNMKGFLIDHHFETQDSKEHFIMHDLQLFDHILKKVLPDLVNDKTQPFSLLILNTDTHPDFYVDSKCSNVLVNSPTVFRSFTCFDEGLKTFINGLEKLGINKDNTEFIIYGDHLTMGDMEPYYGSDRTLSVLFPFYPKSSLENKTITYYDLAPTILQMLGVHYFPNFPFGLSIYSPETSSPPTLDDFKFLYNYLTGDVQYKNIHCRFAKGFCTGNEY